MLSSSAVHGILEHLGGRERLEGLGAHDFFADDAHVAFTLDHSPRRVHTVSIALQFQNFYRMDCYGPRSAGSLQAPLLVSTGGVLPENLATVLGQLTGIDALHHRHF